ncbi:hypothetical protein [Parageobacillus sp. KH3-4]|jgi:hypothetical protein|uniref:hypothetical protein n=1 Tax=Parageobacillus sp. KH3-4 TaxID=2916802 RepID=UPI001FCA69FC|nr:hypothetical protein [Parageobacillus sp. KH3-4]BDG48833.1 hypothetical protein PspKH34_33940 [Parageobacillus sp. KH3-4]
MGNFKFNMARYLEELISFKWVILGVIIYFYGAVMKNEIVGNAYKVGMVVNGWDITLNLLNDMYIIVYFIIPLELFISTTSILADFNYETLIRLGTLKKWVFRSLKHFWKKTSILLLIWAFMSIYMTIGLPFSWNWSQFSNSNHIYNNLNKISVFFQTPLSAFIFQLILLFLTLSLLHLILSLLYVTTRNKNFILIICVIFFLGGMAGFKLLPKEFAFLSPTTYFSVTKYLDSFNSPILGFGILLGLIIICLLYLLLLDLNKKKYFQTIKPYLSLLIYLFLCFLGIVSTSISLNSGERTILDVWIMSFRGSSSENFIYFPFFFYSIVFFGFIYLVNVYISEEIDRMGYYKIIRFRNLNKWFWSWFKKILIKVVFLLLLLTLLSISVGAITGMKLNFYTTVFNASLYAVFYHFFINGFLQIVFYIFSVFIVSWIRKEPVHGLILISVFMILMLPGTNPLGLIPVGLNSLVYLEDFSPFHITLILLMANFLVYLVIKYLFTKSLKI